MINPGSTSVVSWAASASPPTAGPWRSAARMGPSNSGTSRPGDLPDDPPGHIRRASTPRGSSSRPTAGPWPVGDRSRPRDDLDPAARSARTSAARSAAPGRPDTEVIVVDLATGRTARPGRRTSILPDLLARRPDHRHPRATTSASGSGTCPIRPAEPCRISGSHHRPASARARPSTCRTTSRATSTARAAKPASTGSPIGSLAPGRGLGQAGERALDARRRRRR